MKAIPVILAALVVVILIRLVLHAQFARGDQAGPGAASPGTASDRHPLPRHG